MLERIHFRRNGLIGIDSTTRVYEISDAYLIGKVYPFATVRRQLSGRSEGECVRDLDTVKGK